MLIIDDKEFVGEKQSLSSKFLSLPQLKVACKLLNRVAYEVFQTEQSMAQYSDFFRENLQQVL
jgi:hypothetical protein